MQGAERERATAKTQYEEVHSEQPLALAADEGGEAARHAVQLAKQLLDAEVGLGLGLAVDCACRRRRQLSSLPSSRIPFWLSIANAPCRLLVLPACCAKVPDDRILTFTTRLPAVACLLRPHVPTARLPAVPACCSHACSPPACRRCTATCFKTS